MNKLSRFFVSDVPEILVTTQNQVLSLAYSILYGLVFLTLYTPFSSTSWFHVGHGSRFLWTLIFVFGSISFLVISRILLSVVIKNRRHFSYFFYDMWRLSEILLVGLLQAMISREQLVSMDFTMSFILFKSFFISFLSLGVPYIVSDLVILLLDTRKMLMLTNSDTIESDGETIPESINIINISDNKGQLKLSIKLDNLYYIKSEDNYIKVYYTKAGILTSYMLRCKLQTIDDTFGKGRGLARCHRSYVVNLANVKGIRNESGSFFLDFDIEGASSVPVSKTYSEEIIKQFSKN